MTRKKKNKNTFFGIEPSTGKERFNSIGCVLTEEMVQEAYKMALTRGGSHFYPKVVGWDELPLRRKRVKR